MMETKFTCFWREQNLLRQYRTAVSLHGHTNRSKESLFFLPQLARRFPMLYEALEKECRKSTVPVDFKKAYWTPPLTPMRAYETERNQIEELGLNSLVSLTDHDSIEAPALLRTVAETAQIPVALEWTVPFADTTFHLGIHNLPSISAQAIVADLNEARRIQTNAGSSNFWPCLTRCRTCSSYLIIRSGTSLAPASTGTFPFSTVSCVWPIATFTRLNLTPRGVAGRTRKFQIGQTLAAADHFRRRPSRLRTQRRAESDQLRNVFRIRARNPERPAKPYARDAAVCRAGRHPHDPHAARRHSRISRIPGRLAPLGQSHLSSRCRQRRRPADLGALEGPSRVRRSNVCLYPHSGKRGRAAGFAAHVPRRRRIVRAFARFLRRLSRDEGKSTGGALSRACTTKWTG